MTDLSSLAGRIVLVAEDEFFVADDLVHALERRGARVVGPATSVAQALRLTEATPALDAAVLDINLKGEMVFPVADALSARGVPFVFATGYGSEVLPSRYSGRVRCEKPVDPDDVARALMREARN
ncbi:response regulator [Salinarimonas sp.]|uniref:response regulator n=1 Tax=Salinarimonas sp. TaxID=2766526 RepID=UPI0032D96A35